jgi:hypothetical protein
MISGDRLTDAACPPEKLAQAVTFKGATMLDGTVHD